MSDKNIYPGIKLTKISFQALFYPYYLICNQLNSDSVNIRHYIPIPKPLLLLASAGVPDLPPAASWG